MTTNDTTADAADSGTGTSGATAGLLAGKTILVTGVITDASIGFHIAKHCQLHGAEVIDEDLLRLHFTDVNILADEIASFGPEAEVLTPPTLRAAVVQRLTRIRSSHTEGES